MADYYDSNALLDRLTAGVKRTQQRAIFLIGSALTTPTESSLPGVPGVEGVIDIIRREFDGSDQTSDLDRALTEHENRYQAAFTYLLGHRGQQAANEVIKRAVWKARKPVIASEKTTVFSPTAATSDETCRSLDSDYEGWVLPPGITALGGLLAGYPDRFGRSVLTTNFDPLLEVSISKSGGHFFRTVLHRDGDLTQTEGTGCHVIHLHGYWYDAALICYRKSAILLEKDQELNHVENKAFARKWIGELLIYKGEFCLAKTFLDASRSKWEIISPPRVAEIDRVLGSIRDKIAECKLLIGEDIERFCIAWIFGRDTEFETLNEEK